MPEPAVEPLAPNTPERISSSQSSSVHSGDDVMVLESSPGRPGTSRVAHIKSSGVSRLSSFFYNKSSYQSPGSSPSTSTTMTTTNRSPKKSTFARPPIPRTSSKDFGEIVRQFKWSGASSDEDEPFSKKRVINLDSPEQPKRHKAIEISDNDEDEDEDEVAVRPGRRLQRGTRPRGVVPLLDEIDADDVVEKKVPKSAVIYDSEDEDSGDDVVGGQFQRSFEKIEPHVMRLFNDGTAEELAEKTGATAAEIKLIVEMRPFEDMDEIEYSLRKTRGVRLAIFNHYRDTVLGHAEVEQVIHQCSGIFGKLKASMAKAGVTTDEKTGLVQIRDGVELQQPKMISPDFSLKHYQLEGVEWLHCLRDANASGILADEMGLGKTFQVIAFLCKAIEEGRQHKPSLVVCPSSTLDNWMNECAKFAPNLRAVAYYGSQAERAALQSEYDDQSTYDVMITTYNVATTNKLDRMFLKRRRFSAMVLDEGHMVKNCMSSRYKWLMQIRADFRLLLTGTPLQNNLQELVSLLTFILPEVFAESQTMLRHAFKTKSTGKKSQAGTDSEDISVAPSGAQTPVMQGELGPVEARHIEQAKTLLKPFVLRRRKIDVLGDLPVKTEHITRIELTESQRALYEKIAPEPQSDASDEAVRQKLMHLEVGSEPVGKEPSVGKQQQRQQQQSWISSFMDMRKVADHPLLLRSHYTKEKIGKMARQLLREPDYAEANLTYVVEDMEVCSDFELHKICTTYPKMHRFKLTDSVIVDSGKVQRLQAIVEECVERNEKLLVFSQFTSLLDILESVFKIWQVEYCRLDGQTKVDERQAMIDEFNNTERFPVFLLSTKAGGFGINLTSANVVVIFDSGNNPSEERQAEDRAHRVGQTKDVRVYRFIANGTIDEDIWECSRSKMLMEQCFWLEGLGQKAEE